MNNDDCILPNDTLPKSVSEVMATWGLRRLWTGVAWKGSAGRGYLEIAGVQMTLGKTSATMTMKLTTASLHETLKAREIAIVRTLASPNPTPETIQSAIDQLSTLITEHPTYPPAYVNRAQALRMLISTHNGDQADEPETETDFFTAQNAETVSSLLSDLGEAIGLATPRSPADPVSEVQARLLADAHTHRGYLLLRLAKVKKSGEAFEGTGRWSQLDADRLEEMASRDFFFGGRFGNKVAQQLAVQTNPYAKMCGAIVKEALRKEVEG
ncbi:hypothetical protein AARAC_006737 [Aspergillus arachidicola]|uniref:Uncharacterized protein n=1 Tax=Aspergillus arachidicola TaxID=656916 RepID=A0A2G7G9E7_9EURO|nr:hypothetical protein AARAC_006737 [Aspergillus arachidicola]